MALLIARPVSQTFLRPWPVCATLPLVPRVRYPTRLRAADEPRPGDPTPPPTPAAPGEMPRPFSGTNEQPIVRGKPYSLYDAMQFAGPAPEIINGRLAMLGFIAAMGAEMATGQGILQQLWRAPLSIIVWSGVFIAASLIPILRGTKLQESYGPWRPDAEIANGRLAMLGILGLMLTEAWKGGALWTR